MKRFLAAMTLGMALVMGTVSAQAADLSVTVNGTAITFDAQPFIEQGITLVPMRAIMDTLDASVEWDAAAKTVTATKGDKIVVLTINSKQAIVNGQAVELDVAAKIVGNRTFVPVKFIGEQFGLNVEWNGTDKVVALSEIVVDVVAPESETTPVEGETTPAEGETTPVEGETAPVEGETAPAEGETAPVEGETAPTEDETTTPAEGETAPTEDETTTPAEGETTPTEDETTTPAEGETAPEAE
ncbi:stalk domain-containing protein [Lachnospiraceae bacterium 46-61]